jgi:hypothetical protein
VLLAEQIFKDSIHCADVAATVRAGLALDAEARRFAVVSDDTIILAAGDEQLANAHAAPCGGAWRDDEP